MAEAEKPWTLERHAKNLDKKAVLSSTRSFLYAQIGDIDAELRVINTEILEFILSNTETTVVLEDPSGLGYGKTDSPLDIAPPRFSSKGIFRAFRKTRG